MTVDVDLRREFLAGGREKLTTFHLVEVLTSDKAIAAFLADTQEAGVSIRRKNRGMGQG
jgi:hypothetical protein